MVRLSVVKWLEVITMPENLQEAVDTFTEKGHLTDGNPLSPLWFGGGLSQGCFACAKAWNLQASTSEWHP
eukprot:768564-Amphidinium_carterae.2